ncbi:MAG: EamA family transporter [Rhizobiaceae bacterium]|nr:EamA family transporter [Rhizobiaceae bacterium]
MDTLARPQNIKLGVGLILAAALAISVQDVIIKLFSDHVSLWQIFALRGCIAVPMLLMIGKMRGSRNLLKSALSRWPLMRSLFITTTFLAFYAAIPFLSLSTVGAANYIAPIFVTLLSAYVIAEPVRRRGWIGVALGFVGVMVLLQPGSDAFSPWSILPIIGAAFYALAHITTRTRCQGVPVAALSLSQNIIMGLAGFIVSGLLLWLPQDGVLMQSYPYVFGSWLPIGLSDFAVLVLLAGFAVAIGMLLAGAYQAAPPSTVATFEYTYLVFVAVWDAVFFASLPNPISLSGMALIIIAGLLVLRK